MKRTGIVLGLIAGMLVVLALVLAGTAEPRPALASVSSQGDDESCVACHTSKEILQSLAVEPEEEGEELSEGEG